MAKTLAVVGAGPGVGLGVARRFGAEGFRVGLIARTADRLDALVAELKAEGVEASAHPADITDRDALAQALTDIKNTHGSIDVLEYGPAPQGAPIAGALATTVENTAAQLDLHVLGAIAAVRHVLPDMLERGDGAILLTTGASSALPIPMLANVGLAMAGLRNWAYTLHSELAGRGVFVGTVTIGVAVGEGEGDPVRIGERYYDLYLKRDRVEETIGDLDQLQALVDEKIKELSAAGR
ncbi:SDR family NAD(P)-dependent oxidoreductase [Lentzea sp. NPDC055074]